MKGTWLTSVATAEDPAQESLTNHLKILGGQRIRTHKPSVLE